VVSEVQQLMPELPPEAAMLEQTQGQVQPRGVMQGLELG